MHSNPVYHILMPSPKNPFSLDAHLPSPNLLIH